MKWGVLLWLTIAAFLIAFGFTQVEKKQVAITDDYTKLILQKKNEASNSGGSIVVWSFDLQKVL